MNQCMVYLKTANMSKSPPYRHEVHDQNPASNVKRKQILESSLKMTNDLKLHEGQNKQIINNQ
jgi:hypothetical protein